MDLRSVETRGGVTKTQVVETGSGRPLIFFHGAGGLFPDDPFLREAGRRFHVHAPLLPGYEGSEGADALRDMLDFALWGLDVIDALGLERPLVVGHSMGGMIAAEMAAVAPKEVERLCLVAPAGLWLDEKPIPDLFAMLPFELPALLFHDVEAGMKLFTAGLGAADGDLGALAARFEDERFLADFMVRNARQLGMAGKILFPIPERGLERRLGRIRARTLLVWGEEDRLIDPAYADAFRRHMPGAELLRVPRAGHMVPYEQPDALLGALASLAS
jgi:pimeloyl-ACP methyl ester carboxylesterase